MGYALGSIMRVRTWVAGCFLLAVEGLALAQAAPPTDGSRPAASVPTPTPPVASEVPAALPSLGSAEGSQAPAANDDPQKPAVTTPPVDLPVVSDAMLEPPSRAGHELQDWRQAVQLAVTNAPDLQVARAQIAQAIAQSRLALAGALPQLTANGSLTRHLILGEGINFRTTGTADPNAGFSTTTIPDPATRWQASLNFRQPLLALALWDEIGTAKRSAELGVLTGKDTARRLLASIAGLIVNVITTERLAEVSRVNLQSALSTVDLTRRRAQLGAAATLDVLRAEQEVASSRGQIVQTDEGVRRAREALGLGLGFAEAWGVSNGVDLNRLVDDARKVCAPTAAADERADVQAAQVGVEIALRRRDNADLLFAPTLDLVSDATYSNSPQTINGKAVQWTVGALLSVPLYDGSLRYGMRDQADAGIDLARAELDRARRQALLEIEQARRNVGVAQATLSVSAESRKIARETARLSSLSFVHGTGTSFEVVEAARRQRETEIEYVLKEFEVIQAQVLALLAAANCDLPH